MTAAYREYTFKYWMDTHRSEEIFFVLQVQKVMPKTFVAFGSCRYVEEGERLPRSHIIADCKSEADALALRDRFFAIRVDTGKTIEKEMYRRVDKFAARAEGKTRRR
ncbi:MULTISPECIES: hypothetical protein [Rhizobium]|uniref:Uncharacterized protein n=3 Tax=Rhizobium TaxID=379 RepID=A0A6P1CDC6_RHITR|nr:MULTISPECIES: hypothetical protein [Rhizobium]AGB73544.1 hypothetical protein RTCIAT899_PB01360 [Rhizobium tropici CIAT 899]AYG70742.1 hypothetical protein CCGE531_30990 [Rhizobium sp. CCGE531]AYG77078.1 hypothetical protein CCGE532_30975 [Rhizobium sp. CCGE532]ENN84797.1 hypothetical protein RHSP_83186 [Rhizobium freirei PRF 81]MBB4244995.1 hypothetical protein [Rhizobium tropici]